MERPTSGERFCLGKHGRGGSRVHRATKKCGRGESRVLQK